MTLRSQLLALRAFAASIGDSDLNEVVSLMSVAISELDRKVGEGEAVQQR